MAHLRITSSSINPYDAAIEIDGKPIDVDSVTLTLAKDRVISATIELATIDVDVHANVDTETRATSTMSVFGEPFTLDGICKLVTHLLSGLDADTLNDLLAKYRR